MMVQEGSVCDVVQASPNTKTRGGVVDHTAERGLRSSSFPRSLPPLIDLSAGSALSVQRMTEERILDTYRTVWDDFYAWEAGYASGVIASLTADGPARDTPSVTDACFSQDADILAFRHSKQPIADAPPPLPEDLPRVQPHPRYQACTPSNQNIMAKRSDYNPFVTALFIPFADEPGFQSKSFVEEFLQETEYTDPKLHWQSIPDPDRE